MDSTNSSAATAIMMVVYFLFIGWLIWIAGKIIVWGNGLAALLVQLVGWFVLTVPVYAWWVLYQMPKGLLGDPARLSYEMGDWFLPWLGLVAAGAVLTVALGAFASSKGEVEEGGQAGD